MGSIYGSGGGSGNVQRMFFCCEVIVVVVEMEVMIFGGCFIVVFEVVLHWILRWCCSLVVMVLVLD